MGGSLRIARLWGIDIQVHWSFILILVYGAFIYSGTASDPLVGAIYGIAVILLLFLCVSLHELGHALTAKYFHVNVPYITLLPIGGVAQLERMPRRPWHEFLIAIAGPAVNFVLALLLLPVAILFTGMAMRSGELRNVTDAFGWVLMRMQEPGFGNLILYLTMTNVLLGVFNLLPAFPMDGGRVLRALLALTMPYVRATRVAVLVGRAMAVIFALLGIAQFNIFLLLIAFFVYVGGRGELEAVESRHALKDLYARQALNQNARQLYTSERLDKAVDLIMTTYQADFPIFDLSNNFVGVITRSRVVMALRTGTDDQRISDIMIPAREIPIVPPDTSLADIWERMMEERSQVVVVKEAGRFLGLITLADISEVIQVMGAVKEGNNTGRLGSDRFGTDRLGADPTPPPQAAPTSEDAKPEEQKPG
ncbi:MAG: site-2 protease family protein [Caldilineaceae bacterium]